MLHSSKTHFKLFLHTNFVYKQHILYSLQNLFYTKQYEITLAKSIHLNILMSASWQCSVTIWLPANLKGPTAIIRNINIRSKTGNAVYMDYIAPLIKWHIMREDVPSTPFLGLPSPTAVPGSLHLWTDDYGPCSFSLALFLLLWIWLQQSFCNYIENRV